MTVELVHGFAGTPHIEANDIASFNTGVIGPADYVLDTKGRLKASMSNANTFVLDSGDLIMQGRHVTFISPTTAIVGSGSQGMKRNDLAVCRYTKAANGVETAELVIIQGKPTQGAAADPDHEQGRIIEGATIADMPLYRIPIDGISVGTPIPIYRSLRTASYVQDQMDHLPLQRFGSKVFSWQPGTRQGLQLVSPAELHALFGHGWNPDTMTGYAMCTSDDQLDVTSCDGASGFNIRFNVHTGGLHRVNWCITDWSNTLNA